MFQPLSVVAGRGRVRGVIRSGINQSQFCESQWRVLEFLVDFIFQVAKSLLFWKQIDRMMPASKHILHPRARHRGTPALDTHFISARCATKDEGELLSLSANGAARTHAQHPTTQLQAGTLGRPPLIGTILPRVCVLPTRARRRPCPCHSAGHRFCLPALITAFCASEGAGVASQLGSMLSHHFWLSQSPISLETRSYISSPDSDLP